jgi:hypothetical protein
MLLHLCDCLHAQTQALGGSCLGCNHVGRHLGAGNKCAFINGCRPHFNQICGVEDVKISREMNGVRLAPNDCGGDVRFSL